MHSDWGLGVRHPYGAAAGLDVENPEPVQFGKKLVAAVEDGQIEPGVVDTACRRILRTTYRFACAEDPLPSYDDELVACAAHRAVAREAAEKAAVLLTNDGTLPLPKSANLAVFGRLAALANTGDFGSSAVRPPYVVTALQGIAAALERAEMALSGDESDPSAAAQAAQAADAAVDVVGYTAAEEGEFIHGVDQIDLPDAVGELAEAAADALTVVGGRGGDRASLRLPADQVTLIRAVCEANPRTVVVIVAGSAVMVGEWSDAAASVLQTFYSGMEGGNALAALLFGEVSPSGKLPFTVAADEADYPFFDRDADSIEYGPWHGYSLFEREGRRAQFPFGHGLSYAEFVYRGLKARRGNDGLAVEITVYNDGDVPADEVTQLYVGFPGVAVERPRKLLRGFQRTRLGPGDRRTLRFEVPLAELRYWCAISRDWQLEHGEYTILVGGSSEASRLKRVVVAV